MSSINDIVTTSSEEKNVASIDNMTIVSSDNKNASSPDTKGTTSSNGTRATTNKRKQVFDDAQEEAQESPKKRARALTGFEFVSDTFGYTFKDLSLLFEALDTTGIYRAQSNQSLALIGDSILQTTIYRDWYPSKQLRGTGNQLVQTIGCNANLAKVATKIGLDAYIVSAQNIVPPQSLLATTMEAVLGAIDCDSGEDANAVRKAMEMVGLVPVVER